MTNERPESGIPQEVRLIIGGKESRLRIVDQGRQDAIHLEVDDIANKKQVEDAARKALEKRYWFANPQWETEVLKERFGVELGNHRVEIFAFGANLQENLRTAIVRTLGCFYNRLRDKSRWNLESVQILPRHDVNPKSGEQFRGMEFPDQRRLELYPAGMSDGRYRNGELPCTELEGTLAHEITHVVLEPTLAKAWESEELGWIIDENVLIELPGGARTAYYNERPQECPTGYAGLKPDDDRADSVVAYLFASDRLSITRKRVLSEIFTDDDDGTAAKMTSLEMKLPEVPNHIPASISQGRKHLFGNITTRPGKEKPVMALSDFRKERGIREPKF